MNMKRLLAATVFGALGLVGCGEGVQSPDFTAVLTALTLEAPDAPLDAGAADPNQRVLPSGLETPLVVTGTYTTPPGSPSSSVEVVLTDVDFEISPADPATTIEDGQFRSTDFNEVVSIVAKKDGEDSPVLRIRIGPAVLTGIRIDPSTQSIPLGGTRPFTVQGVYTDGVDRPQAATFTENSPSISLSGTTMNETTVRGDALTPAGAPATLTATATVGSTVYTANSSITVGGKEVSGLVPAATCDFNPIGIAASTPCRAMVTYSDGSASEPADGLVTWSSATSAVATIVADTGIATGVAAGSEVLTATLITPTGNLNDSATVTLRVLASANGACPSPLVFPTAVVAASASPTCLLCAVNNPGNVIDDNATTFGTIDVTLALLLGTETLSVNALPANTPITASTATPRETGFVVAQPAGMLLSAELLSTLTVSTLDSSGMVVQSGGAVPQPTQPLPPVPLQVTLLGMIGGQDAALISFDATQDFNGIALTFNSGLVSLLPTINVFQACGTANSDFAAAP